MESDEGEGEGEGEGDGEPSETVIKTLFAYSGNICAFISFESGIACEERLTDPGWRRVKARICHIAGRRKGSARHVVGMSKTELHSFDNLILLCPNHHTMVDDLERDKYTADVMRDMKLRTMERAESPERWIVPDQTLEQFAQELLVQMRSIWDAEDSDPAPSIGLIQKESTVTVANHGTGSAHRVKVEVVSGPEHLIEVTDVQDFDVDGHHDVNIARVVKRPASSYEGEQTVGLQVSWSDASGQEFSHVFPIDVSPEP